MNPAPPALNTKPAVLTFAQLFLTAVFPSFLLISCSPGNGRWITYEEVTVQAQEAQPAHAHQERPQPQANAEKPVIQWECPTGWTEETGTGMRLATFNINRDGASGICTIISLSGVAGGLEANVQRWLGQLEQPAMPPDELAALLDKQESFASKGGLDVMLVDLTSLSGKGDDNPSILAAVVKQDNATIFIKFNGPVQLIEAERNSFMELCKSLTRDSAI